MAECCKLSLPSAQVQSFVLVSRYHVLTCRSRLGKDVVRISHMRERWSAWVGVKSWPGAMILSQTTSCRVHASIRPRMQRCDLCACAPMFTYIHACSRAGMYGHGLLACLSAFQQV